MENKFVEPYHKRVWAEINIDNVIHNYNSIINKLTPDTKICCVVKANAYGHGALQLAKEYERLGAFFLAVADISEAMQLRNNGIVLPILILGYTDPQYAEVLGHYNISQCVFSCDYAKKLNEYAKDFGVFINVHLKIDTGMGRLGFMCTDDELKKAATLKGMTNLKTEGIFTHFSSADEGFSGYEYTNIQIQKFNEAVFILENQGMKFKFKHASNSAAALEYPNAKFDMVRLGIALYGYQSKEAINKCDLKPVMTLKTIISFIKKVPPGTFISYGREEKTDSIKRIATLPIGYADGLLRSNYNNSLKVLVNGHSVPVVGRICMDQCMIDISDFDDIKTGDEVLIFGEKSGHTADDIALLNNTISYEILCSVGARVPRVYKKINRSSL